MTPAISASSSAVRIRPLFTYMKPPGNALSLTSSESIALIVKGTLASEFLTRFCAIRFTYSTTTGSLTNLTLFSSCMAYDLPMRISVSVEYQLPIPRPPMSRVPTALTSSMLPVLTPGIFPSAGGTDVASAAGAAVLSAAGAAGAAAAGGVDGAEAGGVDEGWLVGGVFCPYPGRVRPGAS